MKYVMLAILMPFLLGFASCQHKVPKWNGKIWVGVPEDRAIERGQDPGDPVIHAEEERFRGVMCFESKDFDSFVNTYVFGCKDWGSVKKAPASTVYRQVVGVPSR